jgi:glycosyltransferase involved in cell wall biosynthesis
MPNKVFDYMGAGLPVVSSDAAPLRRLLESEGCGVVFRSGDAHDFAEKVVMVSQSGQGIGARGMAAVRERYNWERDAERLLAAVRRLLSA